MRALTVLQPWAHLLMLGATRFHIRRWKTNYRGRLLIHAGQRFPESARKLCAVDPFRDALAKGRIQASFDLPRGVLLGTITLENCLATDQVMYHSQDEAELAFGDFRPGNW